MSKSGNIFSVNKMLCR